MKLNYEFDIYSFGNVNDLCRIFFYRPTPQMIESAYIKFLKLYKEFDTQLGSLVNSVNEGDPSKFNVIGDNRNSALCEFFDLNFSHIENLEVEVDGETHKVDDKFASSQGRSVKSFIPPYVKIQAMESLYFQSTAINTMELSLFLASRGQSLIEWQKEIRETASQLLSKT